ncbi:hypothetical protein [Candidatus Epulonipiscium viviparus]|uniref:hypothetical protein n=1 Tax=Candidatus Epulonipiscium viviparus TaxID=420336 RepID=UPI00016C0F05|nr:hypothetical protein [Candidatus Epulopiscium viviparus]
MEKIYMTLDCEFDEFGLVRELALILFDRNKLIRVLEIFISQSGASDIKFKENQNNYHINNPQPMAGCINEFLKGCEQTYPLNEIKFVGMSLEHDLKSLDKTINTPTNLNKLKQRTQLEVCGRGTLEIKADNFNITKAQIKHLISNLASPLHTRFYKFHTALYDALVTGYVYLKVMGIPDAMELDSRLKKCTHTYYKNYHNDLYDNLMQKKNNPKKIMDSEPVKIPRNFPEVRFRVQKNLSNVFDIAVREIFFFHLTKFKYEPSIKRVNSLKESIMKEMYLLKIEVAKYDTTPQITDPYNPSLVQAARALMENKITIEEFVDFSIYMQQYNLPVGMGTYYRVYNEKKEVYVRTLSENTAKKMLGKLPYATIWQFRNKSIPHCNIEILPEPSNQLTATTSPAAANNNFFDNEF